MRFFFPFFRASKQRGTSGGGNITDGEVVNAPNAPAMEKPLQHEKDLHASHSNLVFGYLNLFSDGVVSADCKFFLLY